MIAQPSHNGTNRWFVSRLANRNVAVNPADVATDLVAMEAAFPDPQAHRHAMAEVLHQIDVISHNHPGREMTGPLVGWWRHKFLSDRRLRGVHADLRIGSHNRCRRDWSHRFESCRVRQDLRENPLWQRVLCLRAKEPGKPQRAPVGRRPSAGGMVGWWNKKT